MYIIPRAQPWPGINRKRSPFPRFRSCMSAFSCLKLTSVTNSQPCRWSHVGPTWIASLRLAPLSHPHTHTHTHTLSLSPSLSGSGITTTHTAPRPAQCTFLFRGRRSVCLILSHFRTHVRTPTLQYNTGIQMFKPLPVQRLSYHSDIEVPLPYMKRCLLTYVLSPCPEPILKKNNPWSFFFFLGAPW